MCRKGRDGQKKKIGKANERKGKVKRGKDEVNGQGGRGVPRPHTGVYSLYVALSVLVISWLDNTCLISVRLCNGFQIPLAKRSLRLVA